MPRTDPQGARTRFGRTLIIANPASQMGAGARIADELQRFLTLYFSDDGPFELVHTERAGHAVELAAGASGYQTVLALGGDGAVHEVANGLMGIAAAERPVLGLVPAGSGNDYARTLGIHDWHGASFEWLTRCEARPMDLGRICGVDPQGAPFTEYYVQTCSFGLDADIALGTMDLRQSTPLRGDALYTVSGVDVFLIRYRTFAVRVQLDDAEPLDLQSIIFAMQVGPTYGSGFKICPEADTADGLLDVCYAAGSIPRIVALPLLLRAKSGNHVGSKHVHLQRARRIALEFADADYPIQADGEKILARRLDIEVVPAALRVLQPR